MRRPLGDISMARKIRDHFDPFEVQGNRGGSFINISRTDTGGIIHLRLGHECVIRFDGNVSVEHLADVLSKHVEAGCDNCREEKRTKNFVI
jgi:hypothetical protein